MVNLCIPKREIKKINDKINKNVEWGGYYIYDKNKIKQNKLFKGEGLHVTVPLQDYYDIHWHTHPQCLISSSDLNQTGPMQPPSVDDIAHTSFKYFTDLKLGRSDLIQIVFSHHAIYIQRPNPKVLENFFKTKTYTIQTSVDNNNKISVVKEDPKLHIWENKWYTPFKTKAGPLLSKLKSIGYDLGGGINDDTGEFIVPDKLDKEKMYADSFVIEKKYFDLCKKFGVDVEKIIDWNKIKKYGLCIEVK
jgi:hypothetical protein